MHQLGGRDRADPHRRRTGNHLRRELHAVMAHLSDSGN
jgi:hypothetical protein